MRSLRTIILSVFLLGASAFDEYSGACAGDQSSRNPIVAQASKVESKPTALELALTGSASPPGRSAFEGQTVGPNDIPAGALLPYRNTVSTDLSPDDVNWDNRISPSLPGADGTVLAMVEFRGNLIVAGDFTFIDNTPIRNIASWDGVSWAPLGADGGPSSIRCLTVFNERLIAGGGQGVSAWDGDSWTSLGFNTQNSATVEALAVYDDELIVSGYYRVIAGGQAGLIAAWDGTSWSTLGTALGQQYYWAAVGALTVFDDELVVGGRFSTINGNSANNIAVWDGQSWSGLGTGTNGEVDALTTYDSRLVVGGIFDSCGVVAAANIACWDGTSWSALGSGIHSQGWGPAVTLGVFDDKLIAGGYFNRSGGAVADYLTAWDGDSWSILQAEPNRAVLAMANYDGKLIIGGMFTAIGEARPARISSWDGNSWSAVISAEPGFNGATRALGVFDHKLYAGGEFTTAGGVSADYIACWNGTSWSPVNNGVDSSVASMMVDDNKLVVGGYFTAAGDVTTRHIAAWDGVSWAPFGAGTPHPVVSMVKYDNALTVADQFADSNWDPGPYVYVSIRSWDGSAWFEIANKSGGEMWIGDLIVFDDKLLMPRNYRGSIEGGFATAYIDSWDGSSWSMIFHGLGTVGGSIVLDDRLLVGKAGWYTGGYIVDSWDGTTWTNMAWSIRGMARVFTFFDNKLIVGGDFDSVGGISANNVAAWDGDSWSPLGSGTNGPVDRLESYDGTLIVAGDFTMAGGKTSPFMAVWTKRDTLDVVLDVKPGSCPNPVNGNSAHGQGKAVLPVAILGTADFDVHDIDPSTVTLNGASPVRWSYEDVGASPDDPEEECACSEAGPDGHTDINLKFYSAEIVASLDGGNVVRVEGQLFDGTLFEGQDCVTVVGSPAVRAATSDHQGNGLEIIGNYPNPFNPSTRISFHLPGPTDVKLEIFNILGQHITTLVDRFLEAGDHSVVWDGEQVASGFYYYRIQAGEQVATNKMLLLK